MASNVENQERTVATKGTPHVALSVHPDFCFIKKPKPAQPFPNYVESSKLVKGTWRTFITGFRVWRQADQLGPPSEPEHAGREGGLVSSTYRSETRALSYSPDCIFEGCGAVRTDDLTSQNHGNTVGRVAEGPLAVLVAELTQYLNGTLFPRWTRGIVIVQRGNTFVIVDKKNKMIILLGTQDYAGTGASPEYVKKATDQINRVWSGPTQYDGETYTVRSMITGRYSPEGTAWVPGSTHVDVILTTDPPSVTSNGPNPTNQPYYGDGVGRQYSTDFDNGEVVAAHEFGHTLGLRDEYSEGPPAPNGDRTVVVWPDAELMGRVDASRRPSANNYYNVISGDYLYQPPAPKP